MAAVSTVAQTRPDPVPAIVPVDSGDAAQWQSWAANSGWRIIAAAGAAGAPIDARIQSIERAVQQATQSGAVDPSRVYLVGRGEATAAVFYAISRVPDLFAAAAALGGSPEPAIDSGLLYGANFAHVPVLWISSAPYDRTPAEQLRSAGIALEWRSAESANMGVVLEWLGQHRRIAYPATIDCETNSPDFARCYWIRMTRFDPAERNDVLNSTRLEPARRASLDLGGFGFKADDPGPGVVVGYLPAKYAGPLKMGDRLVELDGREIPDARRYVELMAQITDERPAVATIQRGRERIRLETRIIIPLGTPAASARVEGQYLAATKVVQVISRAVTEMRVAIPAEWVPSVLSWNGVALEKVETAGCRLITVEKALPQTSSCP